MKLLPLLKAIAAALGYTYNCNGAQGKVYIRAPKAEEAAPVAYFCMTLPKSPVQRIIDGVIMLDGKMYKACSGLAGYQQHGKYFDRYCPIPPGNYEIDLASYWCDTKGIEGYYYHILPDPIVDPATGKKRSEIGLHKDNGAPGTAGCIGAVNADWDKLDEALQSLRLKYKKIRLAVSYKCQD